MDLCLRLDRPPLPRPLAVPPSVLGGPAPTNPSVNPRLSQALWGVLEDWADGTLQEMVIVENFHLIGKLWFCHGFKCVYLLNFHIFLFHVSLLYCDLKNTSSSEVIGTASGHKERTLFTSLPTTETG